MSVTTPFEPARHLTRTRFRVVDRQPAGAASPPEISGTTSRRRKPKQLAVRSLRWDSARSSARTSSSAPPQVGSSTLQLKWTRDNVPARHPTVRSRLRWRL
ncbi:MAG: hypothetical protein K0S14_2142 [Thermomicrobiales bacterium]|nr:hypothetical protein [Thermomicrobiales bacterium]